MTVATNNVPANKTLGGARAVGKAKRYQEASPGQVQKWLVAGEAVLVDVREPDEYAREHIGGAQLMPLSGFDAARAVSLVKPGQKLVMQCRGGRRSEDACRQASSLADSGTPIFTMTGGIEAWKEDHLPVEVNAKVSPMSVMRQVQMVIGLAVLAGSALAWFVDPVFVGIPAFFGAGLVFAGATGTCALAVLIGKMPWNRAGSVAQGASCASGRCG